jgi:hypothetical protein
MSSSTLMAHTRRPAQRIGATVLLATAALSLMAAVPPAPRVHVGATPRALLAPEPYVGSHVARFIGVGAEGRDLVWRGAIGDAAAGDTAELTLRLAPLMPPADAARPAPWPVEGVLFVAGSPERSFAADVAGTIDWRAGRADLHGVVTVGAGDGERVAYTADINDYDLHGHLAVTFATAAR